MSYVTATQIISVEYHPCPTPLQNRQTTKWTRQLKRTSLPMLGGEKRAMHSQTKTPFIETDMSPEDWKVLAEFLGTASEGSTDPNPGSVDGQKSVTVASTQKMTTETKDDSKESVLSK